MTHTPDDVFIVSSSTALGVGENLVLLLNTVIKNLPEAELRKIRDGLQNSIHIADDILLNAAISSDFHALALSDVSTVDAASSCTFAENSSMASNFVSPPSPTYVVSDGSGKLRSHTLNSDRNFVAQQPRHALPPAPTSARIPIPTPASTPVPPMTPHHTTPKDQMHPMIISSRPHVGRPDYKLHPQFVRPGIPGSYTSPPVDSPGLGPASYYVVTKGLYVGIFTSWNECSPWVTKVSGAIHCKVRSWEEARNLYNSRLAAGSCQVLH